MTADNRVQEKLFLAPPSSVSDLAWMSSGNSSAGALNHSGDSRGVANLTGVVFFRLMHANKRVEAVLRSPRPKWGSVSASDISSCILSKIERFKGLHKIPKPTASVSQAAKAIVDDLRSE